ncbi:MAG: DegT/DnrJ/EryC1/StrS family aminotransferase [Proteobacteria bacterium]|nr:DegT/DnrJ/EryC1/StrS family aminotransferase [Pseudomonadota bacterium]
MPNAKKKLIQQASFYLKARFALIEALKDIGIRPGDNVLVPGYHCLSMLAPIWCLDVYPILYKLNEDLSPSIRDIKQKINERTRAIILVHFFGWPQPTNLINDICKNNNISLIEDCAHCHPVYVLNGLIGSAGDYSIVSTRKFYPSPDGGMLIGNKSTHRAHRKQLKLSLSRQIRSLKHLVDNWKKNDRSVVSYPSPDFNKKNIFMAKHVNSKPADIHELAEIQSDWRHWMPKDDFDRMQSLVSKMIFRHINDEKIAIDRRKNYTRIVNALSSVSGIKPLYESIPENVSPYMVPAIVHEPDIVFSELKNRGFPIWRWEILVESDCYVSRYYSKHLFHVPCHQTISNKQLGWIIETLKNCLK